MQAHRLTTTISEDKSVTLEKLPFAAGEMVDVIILPAKTALPEGDRYPLRGTPIRYEEPTEPVAESDWEAAQ